MDKVMLICGACGAGNMRLPKEPPRNQKEANQVYFICGDCERKNMRDGSVPGVELEEDSQEIEQEEVIQKEEEKEEEGALGKVLIVGGIGALIFAIIKAITGRK